MSSLDDFKLGDQLGKVTYGSVYECTDSKKAKKAIKCIPMGGKYKHIIEASIMSTYKHPNIASSDSIFIEEDSLYIVQKLAKNDLAVLTRGNPLSLRKVREYTYGIAKAIFFLHARKIVHGDIKANNILLYNHDVVKLIDFSLSVVMIKKYYVHGIGTQSHRPPECYNRDNWSYPVDIWSFACTIYELAYGANLFPKQQEYQNYSSSDMTWLSILDWIASTEKVRLNTTINGKKIALASVPFKRVKYQNRFHDKEYKLLNNLLLSMLRNNPEDRLIIREILEHPFFTGITINDNPKIIKRHRKTPVTAKDIMAIDKYKISEPQRNISIEILSICYNIPNINMEELCRSCIFISYILTKTIIPCDFSNCIPEKVLTYLNYSFHEVGVCL